MSAPITNFVSSKAEVSFGRPQALEGDEAQRSDIPVRTTGQWYSGLSHPTTEILNPSQFIYPIYHHLFLFAVDSADVRDAIGEVEYGQWLELDHVIVQLWELHSVHLIVVYRATSGKGVDRRDILLKALFPEVMRREMVDLVERS